MHWSSSRGPEISTGTVVPDSAWIAEKTDWAACGLVSSIRRIDTSLKTCPQTVDAHCRLNNSFGPVPQGHVAFFGNICIGLSDAINANFLGIRRPF